MFTPVALQSLTSSHSLSELMLAFVLILMTLTAQKVFITRKIVLSPTATATTTTTVAYFKTKTKTNAQKQLRTANKAKSFYILLLLLSEFLLLL